MPGVRDATDPATSARDDREARLAEIVRALLPEMRRRAPHLSERSLLEAVERIAAHRLADEELAHRSW
jgi:RNA polymerase-interacting CarD/CdnL/TRCF family regulator